MKIYAKQINPEFQESLLFEDGLFPENMVVCGNRDFKERKTAVFTLVENALDNGDLQEALEDLETGGYRLTLTERTRGHRGIFTALQG